MIGALFISVALVAAPLPDTVNRVPLDFRCDGMKVESDPNRSHCRGNVVVRRPDLLLCCRVFTGQADKDWQWDSFTCSEEVRAKHGDELMWAEQAEFNVASGELTLTGKPYLKRGKSLLTGERIVVNINSDRARVDKPRGHIGQQGDLQLKETPPLSLDAPLPSVCPIPKGPRK